MSSGGGGTFPPDENFDEVTAPALPSGWVTTAGGSGVNWTTDDTVADTAPNSAFASEFPAVSDMTLDSPVFTASAGMTLSFRHQYNLEHGSGTTAYDGAVLEIAINGGAFTDIVTAGGVFTSGGYNSVISSTFGNPLAGRAAWSGDSAGFVDAVVTLPPAAAGQPCQLRWRTSDDSSDTAGGTPGWWVDTIHLSTAVVLSPPTLAKAFAPASVGVDTPSTATLTLGNTNGGADTLTADLVDTLPSGLVVAATPNASTTCPSGSVTASSGAGSFSLATGAQIPASGSCTVTVDVEAAAANSYVNTLAAGALQTDAGSNAAAASATLTVTGGGGGTFPPDENFDEVTAPALPSGWVTTAGGSGVNWTTDDTVADTAPNSAFASEFPAVSDMTLDSPVFTASAGMTLSFRHQYNLEHGSGTTAYDGAVLEIAINGGAFTDIVTAGGVFTSGGYNSVISSTFGNPLAGRAAWSGDSAGFVDAVVTLPPAAAGQPCQLRWRTSDDSSDTAGGTPGWWVDTIHLSTAVVLSPPTLAKAFAPASVGVDTPSTATLTLGNTNGGADTLTADLVDTLPSGLVVAATPNASTTCPSGSVTASAGAGSFSLATGAQIPASGSCTVTVDVEAAAANSYVNTLAAGALQTDAGSNASAASATLTVTPAPNPPTLAKAFNPTSVVVNTPSTVTLTLGNTNASADTLTAALTDALPSGLVVANPANASTTCPSGSVTATAGAGSFSLASGAHIPASGSCTVTVNVQSAAANSYVNTLAAGALQTDAGSNASAASATLTVTPTPNPPTLAKTFNPTSVVVNTPSTVTLTLGNTNASADTLTAALTDALPSGLVVANPANASTTCPSGSVTASPGTGSFSLASGAHIPASGSCTVTVNVQSAAANSYVNTLAAGALQTDAGSNAGAASATLTVTPVIITDRIFCDGFEGVACPPSRIEGAAIGDGTRASLPWQSGEMRVAIDD